MPTTVAAQDRSHSRRTKKRRRVEVESGEATAGAEAEAETLPTAKRRKESVQPTAASELEEGGILEDDMMNSNKAAGEKPNSTQDTKEKKKRKKKKKKVPVVQQSREDSPSRRKPSSDVSTNSTFNSAGSRRAASTQKQPTPGPSRSARSPSLATESEPIRGIQQLPSGNVEETSSVPAFVSSVKGKERATSADTAPEPPAAIENHKTLVKELDCHRSLTQELFPSLICNICLYLMHRPFVLSPCGHVACLSCLTSWFTSEPPNQQNQADQVVVHAPPPPLQQTPPAGGAPNEVAIVPGPAPPPRPLPKQKKTCPQCRARIRTRPVEVWPIKDMVGNVVRSKLADPDSIPPALREGAPVASTETEGDPWNNIFPNASVDRDHLRQLLARQSLGDQDFSDGGIYRCVDCFHEIMDGVCTECGRVYHGHLGDAIMDADDFSDEGGMDDDLGFMLGLHPNLRYLDGSDDDAYGLPMNVHWTDDEQEPSDADESEESYESSFIDDDASTEVGNDSDTEASIGDLGVYDDVEDIRFIDDVGGLGLFNSVEAPGVVDGVGDLRAVGGAEALVEEGSDSASLAPPRRARRSGRRGDPVVISSDEEDGVESGTDSPPLRRYGRTRGIIQSGEDDEENSEYSDQELSNGLVSGTGSEDLAAEVAQREREMYGDDGSVPSRRHRSRYTRDEDIISDGFDSDSLDSRSASEDGGVDFMDDEY